MIDPPTRLARARASRMLRRPIGQETMATNRKVILFSDSKL